MSMTILLTDPKKKKKRVEDKGGGCCAENKRTLCEKEVHHGLMIFPFLGLRFF
jgi:hypothetical protein